MRNIATHSIWTATEYNLKGTSQQELSKLGKVIYVKDMFDAKKNIDTFETIYWLGLKLIEHTNLYIYVCV